MRNGKGNRDLAAAVGAVHAPRQSKCGLPHHSAHAGRTPFRIDLAAASPLTQMVRVELINISAIWYIVEILVPDWHPQ